MAVPEAASPLVLTLAAGGFTTFGVALKIGYDTVAARRRETRADPRCAGHHGKSVCAFGAALRERGFASAVRQVSDDTFGLLEPVTGVKKACELTGKSRAAVYRGRDGARPGGRGRRPAPRNALSAGERAALVAVLDSPRFRDKAPRQVWALLIDEGIYLASVSTMYRLLREAGQVRERRAQAAHPARKKPELIAAAPNRVWSWDITRLAGPRRGVYYHLYVMIDIFSRCAVHFEVHATELGELAEDFMTGAIR